MALATRSDRVAHARTGVAARRAPAATRRPSLTVVPRRRAASVVTVVATVVIALMMGAVAVQIQVAQRQLELDVLDRRIRAAEAQYDVLRRERAELRSPGRLSFEAARLGMGLPLDTTFVAVEPADVATVQRSGTASGTGSSPSIVEKFAEYARVKAREGVNP